jgi:hypothetical protein
LGGHVPRLENSTNEYDWLGHGGYFWESDPERALQFAQERAAGGRNSKGNIKDPFVVGAVINLGICLNLVEGASLSLVRAAYGSYVDTCQNAGLPLALNRGKQRNLDCAVINFLHLMRAGQSLQAYDTVRGIFWEGRELHPGSGFRDQDHVQICVRNPECILGYFRPIAAEGS